MSTDYKYRAFISYSHKDEKWASWLHKALETFKIPKYLVGETTAMGTIPERMGKVFRDRDELSTSQSLGTELTQALEDSACQIVICSPNAANSHWTNEEILTYKRLGREDRIFCLIVDGEPGAEHAECFPPAVRFRMGADGQLTDEPAEPIAADARPQGDGKLNAKIKLIAGMFGVGFDALKQRELQRQKKRKAIMTTAAVATMAVTGALGYSVYLNITEIPPVEIEPISVLIADFDNQTGDPVFDGSVEETLNIGIEGATFITAFNRTAAQSQIEKLRPGSKLDEEGARLIAVREGVKLVLAGAIVEDGGSYDLSVRAIDPKDGEVVANVDVTAKNKLEVLTAIGLLAGDLRKALGDDSLKRGELATSETFTAASIEAVQNYTIAQELAYGGKYEEALGYYQKAIDEDPNFGRAYSGYALSNFSLGRTEEAEQLWNTALSLLGTMTEREKFRTLGLYYSVVSHNYQKAIENYETLIQQYPADGAGHNNLAISYFLTLNFQKALEEGKRVLDIYPRSVLYRANYALYAMYAGDFKTAALEAKNVSEQDPTYRKAYLPPAIASLAAGDVEAARHQYKIMAGTGFRGASLATTGLADIDLYTGHYDNAVEKLESGIKADQQNKGRYGLAVKYIMLTQSQFALGNYSTATLDKALALSRSHAQLVPAALIYADAGETKKAAVIAEELSGKLQAQSRAYAKLIEGKLALDRGEYIAAIEALRKALSLADLWLVRSWLGIAYFQAGHYAEALSEMEICDKRRGEATALFLDDLPSYHYMAPQAYWKGRAQQALGMTGPAAASYQAFLELRPDVDRDPLAVDASQRLVSL